MSKIAIIGGGLAGTACAWVLAQHGLKSVLFEASENLAGGASGNPRGIFNPRLSAHYTPEAQFYASAFALTARTLKSLKDIEFSQHGSLHLITNADKQRRFEKMLRHWNWPQAHMTFLNAQQASQIAGINLEYSGVFLPDSGSVSPAKLCHAYVQQANCSVQLKSPVNSIEPKGKGWCVNENDFEAVILACGAAIKDFSATADMPVHTVRGQVLKAQASGQSRSLRCNLCFGGYITPDLNGFHFAGSTFQKWLQHTEILEEDNHDILARAHEIVPALKGIERATAARASLRTSSRDRLPLIGRVAADLPGLYISSAHGSHGIVTSLMAAQMIAGELSGLSEFPFLKSLSPLRFLYKQAGKTSG